MVNGRKMFGIPTCACFKGQFKNQVCHTWESQAHVCSLFTSARTSWDAARTAVVVKNELLGLCFPEYQIDYSDKMACWKQLQSLAKIFFFNASVEETKSWKDWMESSDKTKREKSEFRERGEQRTLSSKSSFHHLWTSSSSYLISHYFPLNFPVLDILVFLNILWLYWLFCDGTDNHYARKRFIDHFPYY